MVAGRPLDRISPGPSWRAKSADADLGPGRVGAQDRGNLNFFLLTYTVSWICFFAGTANTETFKQPILAQLHKPLFLLKTFTPTLVALWLTARAEKRSGINSLLERVLHWNVGGRWYVFAIGYMAAVKLAVALTHRAITGAWPHFGNET